MNIVDQVIERLTPIIQLAVRTEVHAALVQRAIASLPRAAGPGLARVYGFRNVTGSMWGPFRVNGGPFAAEQTMGWHLTDERGTTVGVSCDQQFITDVFAGLQVCHQLAQVSEAGLFDSDGVCVLCGGGKGHVATCPWLCAQRAHGRV